MGKRLGHSPEIRRAGYISFSSRTINTLSHTTLDTPIESSPVKVRPDPLVRSAYPLVAAVQTSMVMM